MARKCAIDFPKFLAYRSFAPIDKRIAGAMCHRVRSTTKHRKRHEESNHPGLALPRPRGVRIVTPASATYSNPRRSFQRFHRQNKGRCKILRKNAASAARYVEGHRASSSSEKDIAMRSTNSNLHDSDANARRCSRMFPLPSKSFPNVPSIVSRPANKMRSGIVQESSRLFSFCAFALRQF